MPLTFFWKYLTKMNLRCKCGVFLFVIISLLQTSIVSECHGVQKNEGLLQVLPSFTYVIECALIRNDVALEGALSVLDQQEDDVIGILSPMIAGKYSVLYGNMKIYYLTGKYLMVANAALEAFRLLVDEFYGADRGMELSRAFHMLDYTSYKLLILTADQVADWQNINISAAQTLDWWQKIKPQIHNGDHRNAIDLTINNLVDAARHEDLVSLRTSAFDLDDLLMDDLRKDPLLDSFKH